MGLPENSQGDPVPVGAQQLLQARVIVVLRRLAMPSILPVVEALLDGGLRAFEVTMQGEDAADQIRLLKDRLPGVPVGGGTILSVEAMHRAVDAGADFLVSPHLDLGLVAEAYKQGWPYIPGVFTPSEVAEAKRSGVHVMKLFPASSGGPTHLRELLGPFPDVQFMPTGGIHRGNIRAFLAAGAVAVGVGSALVPPQLVKDGNWTELTRQARLLVEEAFAHERAGASNV